MELVCVGVDAINVNRSGGGSTALPAPRVQIDAKRTNALRISKAEIVEEIVSVVEFAWYDAIPREYRNGVLK